MEIIHDFLEFELLSIGKYTLKAYLLVTIIIGFIVTKVILWLN